MRIIVTGGGTGGHVFPALEIAKELRRLNDKMDIIFVGNKNGLEEKMAHTSQLPFYGLSTKKLVGQGFIKKVAAIFYLKIAILQSLWFLVKKRPQAIIGVGGYVSAPMIIASFLLGIPRYICEQNVVPGMANKMLAFIARRVFISFEDSRKFFPKEKTIHAGNPVRNEFFALPDKVFDGPIKILVTGGSLGARFLNKEVPSVLAQLIHEGKSIEITHQTGEAVYDEVRALYNKLDVKPNITTFIDNMPRAFFEHDLLISRAGATVCAEIMASGMPAILVPYPFANGHQRENALALSNLGAAIMIEQSKDFQNHLALTLKELYTTREGLSQLAKKAKSMGAAKASFVIANTVLNDL